MVVTGGYSQQQQTQLKVNVTLLLTPWWRCCDAIRPMEPESKLQVGNTCQIYVPQLQCKHRWHQSIIELHIVKSALICWISCCSCLSNSQICNEIISLLQESMFSRVNALGHRAIAGNMSCQTVRQFTGRFPVSTLASHTCSCAMRGYCQYVFSCFSFISMHNIMLNCWLVHNLDHLCFLHHRCSSHSVVFPVSAITLVSTMLLYPLVLY